MIFVSAHHVQQKYGVKVSELARWRRLGIGPTYYHPSARIIRYDIGDVDDWFHDTANAYLHDFPVSELPELCLL